MRSLSAALIGAARGLAIFLPWTAAALIGALAAAAIRSSGNFLTVFPYALGLCAVAGAIGFLWFRVSRTLAGAAMIGAGVVVVLLAGAYLSPFFKAGDMAIPIAIFYVIPFGIFTLGVVAFYFCVVVLPVGGLVLYASGEFRALRQGVGVSVLDLPYGRWRVAALVLLTLGPLALLAPAGNAARSASLQAASEEQCRTETPSSLSYHGLQVNVDIDKPDWSELKRIVGQFATTHGMQLRPASRQQLGFASADPFQYSLCTPGRMVILLSTFEDMGGRSFLFEPTGDRFVQLTVYAASAETGGERTLRELVAAIDARWPGTRFQTNLDLGSSLKQERFERYACRTKIVARDYQACLGAPSDIRKEALFVHSDTLDWLRLQDVMRQFAASHAMTFKPDPNPGQALRHEACAADTALIVADGMHWVRLPPGQSGHKWGVTIDTWVPANNGEPAVLIDDLVATLEAEWPGVRRSRPDIDFCRAAKAQK